MAETITMQPIAMIRPTRECIYAPCRLSPVREISNAEFLEKFADRPHVIQVSFEPDGVSNPQPVTAYGFGLSCWYIIYAVGE